MRDQDLQQISPEGRAVEDGPEPFVAEHGLLRLLESPFRPFGTKAVVLCVIELDPSRAVGVASRKNHPPRRGVEFCLVEQYLKFTMLLEGRRGLEGVLGKD